MVRRQVLTLYRNIMKTLQQIHNLEHRQELRAWARQEFKQNMHEKDEVCEIYIL